MYEFTQDWFTHRIPVFKQCLQDLVGVKCDALEVGSFEGRSATWLLDNVLTHEHATLTCIDLIKGPMYDRLMANLSKHGNKVTVLNMRSERGMSQLVAQQRRFAFIYVDGCHERHVPLHDLVLAHELIKSGGIIAVDDVNAPSDSGYSIKYCLGSFLTYYGDFYTTIHNGYQVWLKRK